MPFIIRTNTTFPVSVPDATETSSGVMSAADKVKLDSLTLGGGDCIDVITFPGADLGAKINAANTSVLGQPATLCVPPGNYTISTLVTLTTGHVLKLGAGTYIPTTAFGFTTFRMQDNTSIVGSGSGTKILEPPGSRFMAADGDFDNGALPSNDNIVASDFRIVFNPAGIEPITTISNINFSNGKNCRAERLTFEGTRTLAIQLGGSSTAGFHGDEQWIVDCTFDGVLSITTAAVNCRNFHIDRNIFRRPGKGVVCVDIEPNTGTDVLEDFTINGNDFDCQNVNTVGVITVQGNLGNPIKAGVIANNSIIGSLAIGAPLGLTTGIGISRAINCTIVGNNVTGEIDLIPLGTFECYRISVIGNRVQSSGGRPTLPAIALNDSQHCFVTGNHIFMAPTDVGWSAIAELDTVNPDGFPSPDFNYIFGNTLEQYQDNFSSSLNNPQIILTGANSRAYNNILAGRNVGGPPRLPRRHILTSGNILDTDDILGVDTSTLAISLTLPDPASATVSTDNAALVFFIQDETGNANTHNISISPHAGELINNAAGPFKITISNGTAFIYSDGANWYAAVFSSGGGGGYTPNVPAWNNFTFVNSWSDEGAPFNSGYWKDPGSGYVFLKGLVMGGNLNTIIAILPVGLRPLTTRYFTVSHNDGSGISSCVLSVDAAGNIQQLYGSGTIWLALDGATFPGET